MSFSCACHLNVTTLYFACKSAPESDTIDLPAFICEAYIKCEKMVAGQGSVSLSKTLADNTRLSTGGDQSEDLNVTRPFSVLLLSGFTAYSKRS